MPALYPAKLTIPINSQTKYELTCYADEATADFEKKVQEHCPGISSFKFNSEAKTLGELQRSTFKMSVNSKQYSVYPNMRSILNITDSYKNKKEVYKLTELNTSLKICNHMVMSEFYDHLVTAAKAHKKEMTKKDVEAVIDKAIASYSADHKDSSETAKHVAEYIEKCKVELARLEAQDKKITRRAHMKAGMMIGAGFLGTFGQLAGMFSAIYIFYDWNVVEPWTWMF